MGRQALARSRKLGTDLQIAHSVREGKKVRQPVKSHPGPA
jgi:hypothetical protein